MMETQKPGLKIFSGSIHNLKLENTTAEIFFQAGDQGRMAATGSLAAVMGLSGIAAGMAAMSTEETREPVTKATFELEGRNIKALLWNFPFKEGDEVQVVVEDSEDGYIGFAVLDPMERTIVLYPYVSAGERAHWKRVIKISTLLAAAISIFSVSFLFYLYFSSPDVKIDTVYKASALTILGFFAIFSWLGYRIGRRFIPFVKMAGTIFAALGWKDVSNINLRKITKVKRKPSDPPAMGDSYFRY